MSTAPDSNQQSTFPIKHCVSCGQLRQIRPKNRLTPDLCRRCYESMQSSRCRLCNDMKHLVDEKTGLCPKCSTFPEGKCSRCSTEGYIFNQDHWLCKKCHSARLKRILEASRRVKAACSSCGKYRTSAPLKREKPICEDCYREEYNGKDTCKRCGKYRAIHHKKEQLCKNCRGAFYAPRGLRNYVRDFLTPYTYNKVLFDLLVQMVDWNAVTVHTDRRLRNFGRLLQKVTLSEPLTWEVINNVWTELGDVRGTAAKDVRRCFRDLGDFMVANGKLEDWETYLIKRRISVALDRTPIQIREVLKGYIKWLVEERHAKHLTAEKALHCLTDFWDWCTRRGFKTLTELRSSDVQKDYIYSLYWQWLCLECKGAVLCEHLNAPAPTLCPHCNAIHSLSKVERYGQQAVNRYSAHLKVFFYWTRETHLTLTGVLLPIIRNREPRIRQYLPEVIEQLCANIPLCNADPVEALTLYLIIFYGFTTWELRHALVPVLFPLTQACPRSTLVESYYLIVPKPPPSIVKRNPGRVGNRVDFEPSAVSWLKPLLKRFELQRNEVVQQHDNKHLFVVSKSVRRGTPVSTRVVRQIVRRASLKCIGVDCIPQYLRTTAMALLADLAGGSVLNRFGINDERALTYDWRPREIVYPEEPGNSWISNHNGRRIAVR